MCKLDAANLGLIAVPETIASGKAHTGIIFKRARSLKFLGKVMVKTEIARTFKINTNRISHPFT